MDATQQTVQQLAAAAASCFESASRDNGDDFIRIKDGSPEWVTELVHAAHHGFTDFLPDDYRYTWAFQACEWLAEGNDPDESSEFADSCVDVYTGRRLAWLASNLNRASYCDDAGWDLGFTIDRKTGIVELIGLGQFAEAAEVFALVLRALEDSVAVL